MIEGIDYAAASTCGARNSQQDEWGVHAHPPSLEGTACLLAVLADGMGGMPAGGQASQVAVRGFLDGYLQENLAARERLYSALQLANRELAGVVESQPELDGMGCTLLGILVFERHLEWISVGDSLIFLYRAGQFRRINPLHVYANELAAQVERGETTPAEANRHPDRDALTSAVQGKHLFEISQDTLFVEQGDVILLASDGIATLNGDELASICDACAEQPVESIADTIIRQIEARNKPGQDNATIVAVRCSVSTAAKRNGVGAEGVSQATLN